MRKVGRVDTLHQRLRLNKEGIAKLSRASEFRLVKVCKRLKFNGSIWMKDHTKGFNMLGGWGK
jgi:hypothetical protein